MRANREPLRQLYQRYRALGYKWVGSSSFDGVTSLIQPYLQVRVSGPYYPGDVGGPYIPLRPNMTLS